MSGSDETPGDFRLFADQFVFSPAVAARGAVALVGVTLLFSTLPVGRTRVSLNVTSELAGIVVERPWRAGELVLDDVVWQGEITEIGLPGGAETASDYLRVERGPLTFPELPLASGGGVVIRAETGEGRYQFLFSGVTGPLEIPLPLGAVVETGEGLSARSDSEFEALTLRELDGAFQVTGTSARRERLLESAPVSSLAFWREDADVEGGTPLSTIRSGLLVLEDVGGRRIELREGEPLALGPLDGVVRSVVLDQGLVHLQFDGYARRIRSGYDAEARTLMPSMLDRLAEVPQIRALVALLALIMSTRVRFHARRKEEADVA